MKEGKRIMLRENDERLGKILVSASRLARIKGAAHRVLRKDC